MVIATRVLKLRRGSSVADVPISISEPACEKAGVWGCDYVIGWPEGERSNKIYGVDSMQALVCALQIVGAELYASEHHKSGNLSWDEPDSGYGFPVVPSLRDLLQGDDAKYL